MRIEPTDATLGAVVTDIDLARLDATAFRSVEAALDEHAVLVFPGQRLSDEEQQGFGRRFGELSIETMVFSNLDESGRVLDPDADMVQLLRGNEDWHTDHSFTPVSAAASILSARVVPDRGGETEWADMRAAYDSLPAALGERIEGLAARHSLYHSQARSGQDSASTTRALDALSGRVRSASRPDEPALLRPLVKRHPRTGRRALFIGRHAHTVTGMGEAESTALLDALADHATRPPLCFGHRWAPGDLAIWDNRCVLHRARPYPPTQPRLMVHTRVAGDPISEGARTGTEGATEPAGRTVLGRSEPR